MPQIEDLAKLGAIGIGVGIGLALAAPLVGGDSRERRRILKGVVRTYFDVTEGIREQAAEASERFSDLVAEVQVERASAHARGGTAIAALSGASADRGAKRRPGGGRAGNGAHIHPVSESDAEPEPPRGG